MITKAKKVQFTTSDGMQHDSIEDAKAAELMLLVTKGGVSPLGPAEAIRGIVCEPREAIAILKVGLPRKPRTARAKAVKSKRDRIRIDDEPPRVRTATEIKGA